jgi:hypothetical protein
MLKEQVDQEKYDRMVVRESPSADFDHHAKGDQDGSGERDRTVPRAELEGGAPQEVFEGKQEC